MKLLESQGKYSKYLQGYCVKRKEERYVRIEWNENGIQMNLLGKWR